MENIGIIMIVIGVLGILITLGIKIFQYNLVLGILYVFLAMIFVGFIMEGDTIDKWSSDWWR